MTTAAASKLITYHPSRVAMVRTVLALALSAGISLLGASCASNQPEPPKPRVSSMPQNLPQSWEGQSRMGGMPTSY